MITAVRALTTVGARSTDDGVFDLKAPQRAPYLPHGEEPASRSETKRVSVQSAGTRFGVANEGVWSVRGFKIPVRWAGRVGCAGLNAGLEVGARAREYQIALGFATH